MCVNEHNIQFCIIIIESKELPLLQIKNHFSKIIKTQKHKCHVICGVSFMFVVHFISKYDRWYRLERHCARTAKIHQQQ